MAIVHRTTPTIDTMTVTRRLSENVSIVSDGLAILVIVRNSVAGIFDELDNAIDFAKTINA